MSALDCLTKLSTTSVFDAELQFCLVSDSKIPYKIDGTTARPNTIADFVGVEEIANCENLDKYAGLGISVQASKVCAIDVDKCFKKSNDFNSIDNRGRDIYDRFKDHSYCEFSFSGTGLRILFRSSLIEKYSLDYYIKNEKSQIEYYQPSTSFRYVTLTGNVLSDHFGVCDDKIVKQFLDDYMKKPVVAKTPVSVTDKETRSLDTLLARTKYLYLTNSMFQNLWFGQAPGSGRDESERDFQILSFLYENVTQNKEMLMQLFESSPYFKSKDSKHLNKWNYQDKRYFNYVYEQIQRRKI